MAPPPAKKQKQASLLSFFGGIKEVKKAQDGGGDNVIVHNRHIGCGNDNDEVNVNDIVDSVNIESESVPVSISSSSSLSSPPIEHSPNDDSGATEYVDETYEYQHHHSHSASSSPLLKGNDDIMCTVTVSPTGSNADASSTSAIEDIAATTIINSTIDDDNDEEGEDDGSSSVSSGGCGSVVNDENDNVAQTINNDGKSAYELLREKNIARNNARLKELGLLVANVGVNRDSDRRTKQPPKRVKSKSLTEQPVLPARRSRRLEKNDTASATTSTSLNECMTDLIGRNTKLFEPEEEKIEESELFSVSPLLEYQMTITQQQNEDTSSTNRTAGNGQGEWKGITSLVPSTTRLIPPSGLNAIYSLQFYPKQYFRSGGGSDNNDLTSSSWIVGAGKSGIVALWDCSNKSKKGCEYIDPVISWKGHGGRWIADAHFLPSGDGGSSTVAGFGSGVPSRLLTAGNDGTICHWDLTSTAVKTGVPKLLNQSSKALHASGIFSMDVRSSTASPSSLNDIRIVTGSKDKSIAVSSLDRLNERPMWRSDFHRAKVGSVNFSLEYAGDIPLIASASDDGLVAIHDARLNGVSGSENCVVVKLEDIHVKPHSAVWMPRSAQIFMTGSFLSSYYCPPLTSLTKLTFVRT